MNFVENGPVNARSNIRQSAGEYSGASAFRDVGRHSMTEARTTL